ncbi:hypothetical protein JKI95_02515 [Corynebacterium aquatimens]|uniref:hypothetical protein n=1 Tax=Corynebacterium TaxID=1716 RepID=UPI001F332681|nr:MULTISPECIES: hypothetical protein [Corynebacterium]QYH19960.1 hypothetical protein JKI95_02515 [Corynebacterium aquatimens]UIZ92859.1 hypothetical protein JZY91_03660 [Corynebacterium sp. CNCTC7651]
MKYELHIGGDMAADSTVDDQVSPVSYFLSRLETVLGFYDAVAWDPYWGCDELDAMLDRSENEVAAPYVDPVKLEKLNTPHAAGAQLSDVL